MKFNCVWGQPGCLAALTVSLVTTWKIEKVLLHIELKRPTISTHFQRPLKELENSISGVRRRRQKVDGFSNNKRSNGSNTHPLKSAILRSRASRSEVRSAGGLSPCASPSVSPCASPSAKSPRKSLGRLGKRIYASRLTRYERKIHCSNYLSATLEAGYLKWRNARNKGLQSDENEKKIGEMTLKSSCGNV